MARLKRTRQAEVRPPTAPEPLPEHVRTPEWNGFVKGDLVVVRRPGKKARAGYRYYFSAHVVSPGGQEYIDVMEVKLGFASGRWRSFPLDCITAPYIPKNPRKKSA